MEGSAPGTLLCGISIQLGESPDEYLIGEIIGCTELGVQRTVVENVHNDLTDNWMTTLESCIARMVPFTITVLHGSNETRWTTAIQEKKKPCLITMPVEEGFDTAATLAFQASWGGYRFGASTIEERVVGTINMVPSGKPVVTAGTPTT